MVPLLEATKRADSMPKQSLPETEKFQILRNFSIFCGFLEKTVSSNDWEQGENLTANDDW